MKPPGPYDHAAIFTIGHSNHPPETFLALVEQHQISLFTPVQGDQAKARKASLQIWLYTLQNRFKKFTTGETDAPPPADEIHA